MPDLTTGESTMDWNRVEGHWKEVKGKVKEKWGKLTDDDLTAINGQREQLEGRLQQRYGYAKDQARKDVDTWFSTLKKRRFRSTRPLTSSRCAMPSNESSFERRPSLWAEPIGDGGEGSVKLIE